jgi:two-component system, OmpR family, sensor histidine kinase KdpD
MNLTMKNYLYDSYKTIFIMFFAVTISFLSNNSIPWNITVVITYILAVVLISKLTTGHLFGILASIITIFDLHYFNSFPLLHNGYPAYEPVVTLLCVTLISIITSTSTLTLRRNAKQKLEWERKKCKLNEINNKLLSMNGLANIIDLALEYVQAFTESTVIFYEKSPQLGYNGYMRIKNLNHDKIIHSHHEQFIAHWVFENKEPAGIDTDFPAESSCTYLPLLSHNNIWGVIGIFRTDEKALDNSSLSSLNIIISQVAMAIERQYLSDNQQLILLESEKEMMKANLLRAVSHDLRTPLTGMIGASETILKNKDYLCQDEQLKLVQYIYEDSNWLLHMVENLLSVTRINDGNSSVNKSPEPLEEVVTEGVMQIRKRYPKATIKIKIPEEFIMIHMDATLIEQVIINLLENAIKHSETQDPVELIVVKEEDDIVFHIMDNGIGIDLNKSESIFDGYSQTGNQSSDTTKGLGIGLSICKTIVNAHGGTIGARNQATGGAVFSFTLPLEGGKSNGI